MLVSNNHASHVEMQQKTFLSRKTARGLRVLQQGLTALNEIAHLLRHTQKDALHLPDTPGMPCINECSR